MPGGIEALGIDRLSVRERLELIEQIWDGLPDNVNRDDMPEWQLAELATRRAAAVTSPRAGKPWRVSGAGRAPAGDPSARGRCRHPGSPR